MIATQRQQLKDKEEDISTYAYSRSLDHLSVVWSFMLLPSSPLYRSGLDLNYSVRVLIEDRISMGDVQSQTHI